MTLLPPALRRDAEATPAARTRVSVRVGSTRPTAERRGSPAVAIVAVLPPEFPWLADLFPGALVRATRERDPSSAVEQARLQGRDRADDLPGLEARSRLRDAVRLALSAGAPSVDLVAVRAAGRPPWAVLDNEVQEALDPFLAELTGALLVYPDLCGPVPVGPGTELPMRERIERALLGLPAARGRWVERTQVALLDHPGATGEDELLLLRALHGADAALCRFSGGPAGLRRHGWRSAAAAAAGALGADPDELGRPLEGRTVPLAEGRATPRSRREALRLVPTQAETPQGEDACLTLRVAGEADQAVVINEPTLRAPIGAWSLNALRLVKAVHRQVLETAERFVFQTVDDAMAITLAISLQRALQGFAGRGLLVGPDGQGPPEVKGGTRRSAESPGLYAILSAQVRPWSQAIQVRVSLRPGGPPLLEQT